MILSITQNSKDNICTNSFDVSRIILQIVAQLEKTEYSDFTSTEKHERCARVRKHSNTPDPASDSTTS